MPGGVAGASAFVSHHVVGHRPSTWMDSAKGSVARRSHRAAVGVPMSPLPRARAAGDDWPCTAIPELRGRTTRHPAALGSQWELPLGEFQSEG